MTLTLKRVHAKAKMGLEFKVWPTGRRKRISMGHGLIFCAKKLTA